ncbi:MAG: arginine biosynthesis protein ArgJ [Candidatus Latescibacteria bacterium]|nr:arginine biosynthesis protein ArgJ [Candidatus Latescibacterota bacterium]
MPKEATEQASMTVTAIVCDEPSASFGAVFTRNAFPGAPVILGRQLLDEPTLGAIIVNNKISNVCAPNGLDNARRTCAAAAGALGLAPEQVLVSSTGIIGWDIPIDEIEAAIPVAKADLQDQTILPAAVGIMTTDLYPKVRRIELPGGGSIVGIAKGAGMVEPDLATMLVYILTDAAVEREALRALLAKAMGPTFNALSIDTDTSTSDTVVALASGRAPKPDPAAFADGFYEVCGQLAEDVVRNGEGVRHVIRCVVQGAPDEAVARGTAKAVVNSPLLKTAIAGNDANIGRLVMAVGKYIGSNAPGADLSRSRMHIGPTQVLADGVFAIDPDTDAQLHAYLKDAELYESAPDGQGSYVPPVAYPPHQRCVEIVVDLGCGGAGFTATGADLTHEYVTENADYRS